MSGHLLGQDHVIYQTAKKIIFKNVLIHLMIFNLMNSNNQQPEKL